MTSATRVAFVSHSRHLYGASRSLLALLEGFRAAGVAVHTVLPGAGLMADALAERGLATTLVPFPCWVAEAPARADPAGVRAAQARAAARVVRHLEGFRPDVVWSNSSVTAVGALAAAALGVPHVWHLRELNGESWPFRFAAGTAAAMGLLRAARARVAVSRAVGAAYEALGSGPCEVIYSSIGPADELAGRPLPRRRHGPLRVVLAARVRPSKGQLAAIEATRRLIAAGHDVRLRILGDGDVDTAARAIAHLGMREVVTLGGFVADLDAEYRQADVALSCSRIEGMGRTTAEAMSYGLPVVGAASVGTLELLEHEVTGVLCDGSPAGLADALARVLREPDAARQIGERAQRVARERFAHERCVASSLAVLARVTAPRPVGEQDGAAAESSMPFRP